MNVATIISLCISAAVGVSGIAVGWIGVKRNQSSDDREEANQMTTVIVKLENISKDTGEIKNDMKDVKSDVRHNTEQIIRLDESLKSAWKRINLLEGKGVDPVD
jgi:hypothetical protein